MVGRLFGTTFGCMTSGGTESILMSMKAHRDWGLAAPAPLERIRRFTAVRLQSAASGPASCLAGFLSKRCVCTLHSPTHTFATHDVFNHTQEHTSRPTPPSASMSAQVVAHDRPHTVQGACSLAPFPRRWQCEASHLSSCVTANHPTRNRATCSDTG